MPISRFTQRHIPFHAKNIPFHAGYIPFHAALYPDSRRRLDHIPIHATSYPDSRRASQLLESIRDFRLGNGLNHFFLMLCMLTGVMQ